MKPLKYCKNIKDKYESHHNVNYTDEALIACVKLTNRYMSDRFLPDKAIDALDEAGSRGLYQQYGCFHKKLLISKKSLRVFEKKRTALLKNRNTKKQPNFVTTKNESKRNCLLAQEEWQETQKRKSSDCQRIRYCRCGVDDDRAFPSNRVAESEGIRLNNLADQIKEKNYWSRPGC